MISPPRASTRAGRKRASSPVISAKSASNCSSACSAAFSASSLIKSRNARRLTSKRSVSTKERRSFQVRATDLSQVDYALEIAAQSLATQVQE